VRRKFVYVPEIGDLVEVGEGAPPVVDAPVVFGDLKPVTIPGGPVITDRGHLRRYLKANDLIPHEDAVGVAARARAEKAKAEAAARKRAVVDAYEHMRNQERARKRYG
jgi:hypothetical protein